MSGSSPLHRPIRSFVLRQGRLTAGQQRAFETLWPRYGCDLSRQPLLPERLFDHAQPLYLEIGFGNGESLAQMAQTNPQFNYLGVEVHRPGVGHLLIAIERLGLQNLRVMHHDAIEVLDALPDATLHGLLLLFPDPWHKKRHHKRRILQPSFVARAARVIRPGGFLHAATDWDDYAQQMLRVLEANSDFNNHAGRDQFTPRPEFRPLTKFEQRGQRLGHGVWDLHFIRQPA